MSKHLRSFKSKKNSSFLLKLFNFIYVGAFENAINNSSLQEDPK
jgi:hypothetical protein